MLCQCHPWRARSEFVLLEALKKENGFLLHVIQWKILLLDHLSFSGLIGERCA